MFLLVRVDPTSCNMVPEDMEVFFIELPPNFPSTTLVDQPVKSSVKTGLFSKDSLTKDQWKALEKDTGFLLLPHLNAIYEEAVEVILQCISIGSVDLHFFSFDYDDGLITTSYVTTDFLVGDVLKGLTGKDHCYKCGSKMQQLILFTSITTICPNCEKQPSF